MRTTICSLLQRTDICSEQNLIMQLSGEPLPKLCDGRSASSSALSAQESASKGDQTTAGVSKEVQEHAASSSSTIALSTIWKPARAASAAGVRSDAALQSREVEGNTCSDDAAMNSSAALSPCHSSAGSFSHDKERAELEQDRAPHVHDPGNHAPFLHETEGDPSSGTSLLECTHMDRCGASPLDGGHRKQHLQPDDGCSAVSMPAAALSDREAQPINAVHSQLPKGEQHFGSKASIAEGAAAHQESPPSSSTSLQTWQTHNAEGAATEPLLQEPLLQNSGEGPEVNSASGSSSSACHCPQEHERSLKRRVRDPRQTQVTEQGHQEGQRAGDGIRQQRRQTDVTLDLAVAVSMVVGLSAVLVCGLFMLVSTYMSANM